MRNHPAGIQAAAWTPDKNGKEAAESNRDLWGGYIFESESMPGFYAWFNYRMTISECFNHPIIKGHTGKFY